MAKFNSLHGSEPTEFYMVARVDNIGDGLLVTVIESLYAVGEYIVIISDETGIYDGNGKEIEKSAVRLGDTVGIDYGGEVMLSMPPRIVARKIEIRN